MGKVQILEKSVADRIAAGEVVERPASVVKELVENSLDAGATRITVELTSGGMQKLKVVDDGCGMSFEDARLALERFATSKIRRWEDMDQLQSLGFRGEALPSVAAVSRLEILTVVGDAPVGTKVVVEGGRVIKHEEAACSGGTRITVGDLYFNTPARRKFLRSPAAETSRVVDLIGKMGVTHPEVQFRLLSNGRELLMLSAHMTVKQRLAAIWKMEPEDLVDVAGMHEGIAAVGLVAKPERYRSNRTGQIFTVNGRLIQSPTLSQAVLEGFNPTMERGRFPFALMNLTLEPNAVDVNVHPTKAEVRFADNRAPFRAVHRTIATALQETQAETVQTRHLEMALDHLVPEPDLLAPAAQFEAPSLEPQVAPRPARTAVSAVPAPTPYRQVPSRTPTEAVMDLYKPLPRVEQGELAYDRPRDQVEVLVQMANSYVVAMVDGELWVVDQHAAHERIHYERLAHLEVMGGETQGLLVPEVIDFRPDEAAFLEGHTEDFRVLGFEVEPFGGSSFQLRSLPPGLKPEHGAEIFRSVVEEAASGRVGVHSTTQEKLREKLRAMVACKSSIRARERLTKVEMERLILDLLKAERSPYCPHGRPTRVRLDLKTLERLFHR